MTQFAKVLQTEEVGEVVVMKTTNDEGNPAIAFYFVPPDLDTCHVMMGRENDKDEDWAWRDSQFEKIDASRAGQVCRNAVAPLFADARS